MKNKTSSVDGFVPRQRTSSQDFFQQNEARPLRSQLGSSNRPTTIGTENTYPLRESDGGLRDALDESLKNIEDEQPQKHRRRFFRRKRTDEPVSRGRKLRKRIIIALIIIILGIGGYVIAKAIINSSIVFKGNLIGLFQNKPLKMDANGRSNILLFGTSEDDKGHEAGYLTDSIMVVSVDQNAKNAYMISIPRDLYVDYGGACVAGYQGKINALFQCYSEDGKKEPRGAKALQNKVGEVLGLDIQYYAHINYSVVRDTVKALDGVTVTIESRDPRGILDSNFDWKCKKGDRYASYATIVKNCPPSGHYIDYPNGPVKLDAEHALYLAQARGNTAPTYGLEQSNFDREKNQQKIIKAIREKAVSAGTVTNVGKVTGLIDAMGKNLRTDFQTSEIRTLMQLGKDIPSDSIKSIGLFEEGEEVVTNTSLGGGSAVAPVAGTFEYSDLQKYVAKKLSKNPVIREAANVAVFNATSEAGVAQSEADILEEAGYSIYAIDNAASGTYEDIMIYQLDPQMSGTAKALKNRYGVEVRGKAALPFEVDPAIDVVVIIGKPRTPQTEASQ